MGQSLRGFIGFRWGLLLLLIVGMVGEGYGQRVYANNYGKKESGRSIPIVRAEGRVNNPDDAIGNSSSFSELKIGLGLLGAYAHLQLKFINSNLTNLPAGTSIYIKLDNGTSQGLLGLGLLLVSEGYVAAYKNADAGNSDTEISGTSVQMQVREKTEGSSYYLIVTPQECFNSIEISIKSGGLLDLLSTGIIRVHHAYYERPEIQVQPVDPICHNEPVILQIKDPLSTICEQEYLWYEQETGGSALLNSNPVTSQYTTLPLTTTSTIMQKMYWVEYTGINNSQYGRTPVTVTVLPKPPAPILNINPNSQY